MAEAVSFRDKCKDVPKTTYVTHGMHSYPAKLIPHIPHYFINKDHFSKRGGFVLDPFCGSGTTLVEAKLSGRNSFGVDINPLARLLTRVKTKQLDSSKLQNLYDDIRQEISDGGTGVEAQEFPDIDYWFSPKAQMELAIIKEAIWKIDEPDYRDFFKVCFSSIIRKCSYADPRISPACKSKRMRALVEEGWEPQVLDSFKKATSANIIQNQVFTKRSDPQAFAKVIGKSAKEIALSDEVLDLVITSPPYINAQKYVRSTKLEIYWLDLLTQEELRELDKELIGTEIASHEEYEGLEFSSLTTLKKLNHLLKKLAKIDRRRAYIAYRYFLDIDQVLSEVYRVLKAHGHFVIVIGNNRFYGIGFPTSQVLTEMAKAHLFELESAYVDTIRSRGLMTKRNKTASMISCEWVLVLRKVS